MGSPTRLHTLTQWLVEQGPSIGVRPPNAEERARALGIGAYTERLGLPPETLYEATGRARDPATLVSRARGPIGRILRGSEGGSTQWPGLQTIRQRWNNAVKELVREGARPAALVGPERLSPLIAAHGAAARE